MSDQFSRFRGMTVAERLFDVGKLDEFDKARAQDDFKAMNVILSEVGLRWTQQGSAEEVYNAQD